MSDFEHPRDGELDEHEEQDFTPDAYEATVPTRLTGFRGTNPAIVIIAGAIALGIVGMTLFSMFHRGGARAPASARVAAAQAPVEPAAPGFDDPRGVSATPFIPNVVNGPPTPFPVIRRIGGQSDGMLPAQALGKGPDTYIRRLVTPPLQTPPPSPPASNPYAQVQLAQQQFAQAFTRGNASAGPPGMHSAASTGLGTADDRMHLDEPGDRSGAQDAQAQQDLAGATEARYTPLVRDGHVVGVIPASEAAGTAPSERVAQAVPTPGSAQFVSSSGASDPAVDTEHAQRRFSDDQAQRGTGYVRDRIPTQLDVATVINARLLTKIESDLPGPVIAQVTQPVYDSATHASVVIPAGTKVYGVYDNATVANQTRLLMAWQRLIFPDGAEFDIGGLPGSDANGTAGFSGDVDPHHGVLYTSAILLSVIAGAEAAITPQTGVLQNASIAQQTQQAAGAQLSQTSNRLFQQGLQRPATLIIRPPYGFQIIVTRDLPLERYEQQHP